MAPSSLILQISTEHLLCNSGCLGCGRGQEPGMPALSEPTWQPCPAGAYDGPGTVSSASPAQPIFLSLQP